MTNMDFTPSFGIDSTIETKGTEILNNLLEPETATSSPEDVTELEDESKKKKEETKVTPPKKEENVNPVEALNSLLEDEPNDEEEEEEEDIQSKEKEKSKEKPKKAETKEKTEDSQFSALAKDFLDLGVFTQEEGDPELKITTAEEFLERSKYEINKQANQRIEDFIGQFGEDYQHAFQSIFVKGVDPKEYFESYNNIQNFADMKLSDEASQVKIIKQGLLEQGFEQEDLETEIERLKNYGDLEKVAERYHKVLVKKEAQKLQQLETQKQQELQQKALLKQQYVENVQTVLQEKLKTKEFDGIPLNPKLVSDIQDYLLTDKYKTNSGEKLTEFDKAILDLKRPENHTKKVKLALLLKLIEKDPTLSTIQKSGVSKKSEGLFNELARQKKSNSTKKELETSSWFVKGE